MSAIDRDAYLVTNVLFWNVLSIMITAAAKMAGLIFQILIPVDQRQLTKKKLKNKRESLSSYCRWGDGLSDYSDPKTAYIRRRHRSDTTTYFKRVSNQKIRREKGFLYNGSAYRKVFDYWWNII